MLSPTKRRASPTKSNESSSTSRSPTKILSALRTMIWSPSKDNSSKDNDEIIPTPSKKQRTEQLNSFITSSPQRQTQRASPSLTPKRKPVRNLTADFNEYERKEEDADTLVESSLQTFVSEHFSEDKENFLNAGLAPPPKSQTSKSLLNTLFSPMFKQYSSFFGVGTQESGNIKFTEQAGFQLIELGSSNTEEEVDDEDSLNKTICYEDDGLNESTTSEDSEHGSLQLKVLGLSSEEKLSDFHYTRETRAVVTDTNNAEVTYYVQQESSYEESEEDDLDEFDPFLFIATLPPLPHEYRQRPVALPAKPPAHPKLTLVLDLDETLVHCSTDPMEGAELIFPVVFNEIEYKVYVRKRPHFQHFLETVAKHFEVVVFTASQEVYASKLLDIIDPKHAHIHHRLYRQSCVNIDGNFLKDLSILGRDLSQVVIVDNSPQTFAYQLDNGIPIESWFDDPRDEELSKLLPFLLELKKVEDVRPHVRDRFKLHERIESARKNNKKLI